MAKYVINIRPKKLEYDVKLFSKYIQCLYSLEDFLKNNNYFGDNEIKTAIIDKLDKYAKILDLEVINNPILTLKALNYKQ